MSATPYFADDAAKVDWDVAVIGTGMGGATTGYELAKCGYRVLFIEKGLLLHGHASAEDDSSEPAELNINSDEQPEARLENGWWPLRLQGQTNFGKAEFFAPLGCGSGGTTSLYGAGLERLFPSDFQPKRNFPHVTDSTLPERWPITYEELSPFYARAEALFSVRGTMDPLAPRSDAPLLEPPQLSPKDQHAFESFCQLGLHPYRHHVGFRFVKNCTECLGRLCRRRCKSDSGWTCLLPALQEYGARILPECEVIGLEADESEVRAIRCRRRGQEIAIRAKIVVLAAGAFMSPLILLNSKSKYWPDGLANRSGMVGRNLMLHAGDFFALRSSTRLAGAGPKKSLACNDFYHVEGEKLGTFQMVGAVVTVSHIMQFMRDTAERHPTWWNKFASPRPWWWRKLSSPLVRLIALTLFHVFNFKRATMWSSIIEDLPYYKNRIVADPDCNNGMRFEYQYTDELKARVRSFRRRLQQALSSRYTVINLATENNINYGHVCGTCRFGDDPKTTVLDKNNRAHDVANLYVVDASFFPSSGGVNPTLTIAANALRVAGGIDNQLRKTCLK